jgi:hypothetical protein
MLVGFAAKLLAERASKPPAITADTVFIKYLNLMV